MSNWNAGPLSALAPLRSARLSLRVGAYAPTLSGFPARWRDFRFLKQLSRSAPLRAKQFLKPQLAVLQTAFPLRFATGKAVFKTALAFFKSLPPLRIGTSPILLLKSINAPLGKLCYIIYILIQRSTSFHAVFKTFIM